MKKIAIFSGTTEGRLLSEKLLSEGIAHIVCVASEYGKDLMREDPLLALHVGRMDAEEMRDFLSVREFAGQGILVDATHPYAAEVTGNIRAAAKTLGCRYLRVVRQSGEVPVEKTALYGSMASCASALEKTSGNILLTTGSKELQSYSAAVSKETLARTFVRVLPTTDSISSCLEAGIDPRHIIAMHGPFGVEMNLAILRQYDISHLVTKESGAAGGFEDKVRAAAKAGAFLHVIARPLAEEGLSVEKALRVLLKEVNAKGGEPDVKDEEQTENGLDAKGGEKAGSNPDTKDGQKAGNGLNAKGGEKAGNDLDAKNGEKAENILDTKSGEKAENILDTKSGGKAGNNLDAKGEGKAGSCLKSDQPRLCVTLAGIGMGSFAGMTEEVKMAIEEAEIIFGAERLLRRISGKVCYPMYRPAEIIPVLARFRVYRALILFSGDSGFYSGARSMRGALLAWREDLVIRTLPGVSSVSALAAKTGVSYDNAAIFSLHGRKDQKTMHQLLQLIRYHKKTFVLLSGDGDVRDLGQALLSQGFKVRIIIGSNLSADDECVRELSPAEAASCQIPGILTALILHRTYEKRPLLPVLQDEDLLRGPIPMTKAEIRHAGIIRLGLREGDVVYDVGGGTGSVALEIAAMDPSLTIYAFERNEEACGLIRENIRRQHADNVILIQGEAPEAFADAQMPDCVFIGGSGGRLSDILTSLRTGRREVRCVLTAVTLETMEEALCLVREKAVRDPEMIQLQCTNIKEVGRYHMLQAGNPVMIISFTIGDVYM